MWILIIFIISHDFVPADLFDGFQPARLRMSDGGFHPVDLFWRICSADFNEWIWKNAATDPKSLRYSYANKREYEIFEFNLANTFNYAEMATLIAPRPFMVERGHFDGVAPDEMVAHEYAKVRFLYAAKLGIADRTEIEWFAGPHSINGVGAFEFLDKHLR